MGRILNLIRKNFTMSLRDNIIVYVLVFPLLMAVGMALFLPAMNNIRLTFAVSGVEDPAVIGGLESFGNVELYKTRNQLVERLERPDDVAGIIRENGTWVIITEGNESADVAAMSRAVLNRVLSERPLADHERISLGKTESPVKSLSLAFLLLGNVIIAGLLIAFSLIEEKETKAINALAVSPLRMREFIVSHSLAALIVAQVLSIFSVVILMGSQADYLRIILSVTLASGLGILFGFLIGGLAQDQISGIGLLKLTMLVLIGIPIGSLFVPDSMQRLLYAFPNYWAFQVFRSVLPGQHPFGFMQASIFSLLTTVVLLLVMLPVLRRKLRLR